MHDDIDKKIHIISDLINHISQIAIRYFTNDRTLFCIYPDVKPSDDFVQFDKQVVQDIFAKCTETQYPILYSTELNECISGIPYFENGQLHGIFIAGPVLTSDISYEGIWQHTGEKNLPIQYTFAFLKKYENMPVMQVDRFGALPKIIYYLLYGKTLNTTDMSLISGQINFIDTLSESELVKKLSVSRLNQSYCGSYQYEKKICEYIENGDYLNLKEFISKNDPYKLHQFSIKNPLQQSKSMFVYYVSMATHASIRGNLLPEIAYSLSEFYIQQADEMKNVVNINALQLKMLLSYAKKVSASEQKNASRHIVKCCEYIFKHLYDELSLAALSSHLSISPNYLSELFHKEMKISVTEYINQQRVLEAKNLLRYTDKSIIDICTILNFRSQSYFTTVFKKYVGTSPASYRKNNIN